MKRILSLIFAVALIAGVCLVSSSCMALDEIKSEIATIDYETLTIEYNGSKYVKLPFDDTPYEAETSNSGIYIVPADVPVLVAAGEGHNGLVSVTGDYIRLYHTFYDGYKYTYTDNYDYYKSDYCGNYCKEAIYDKTVAAHSAPHDTFAVPLRTWTDDNVLFKLTAMPDEYIEMIENTIKNGVVFDNDKAIYSVYYSEIYLCDSTLTFCEEYGELSAYDDEEGNTVFVLADIPGSNGKKLAIDSSYNQMLSEFLTDLNSWADMELF